MTYNIVPSSPKALEAAEMTKSKYPLAQLDVGMSFTVPYNDVSESGMRSVVSQYGKRHNKKFKLVRHDDRQIYEIARIA